MTLFCWYTSSFLGHSEMEMTHLSAENMTFFWVKQNMWAGSQGEFNQIPQALLDHLKVSRAEWTQCKTELQKIAALHGCLPPVVPSEERWGRLTSITIFRGSCICKITRWQYHIKTLLPLYTCGQTAVLRAISVGVVYVFRQQEGLFENKRATTDIK